MEVKEVTQNFSKTAPPDTLMNSSLKEETKAPKVASEQISL